MVINEVLFNVELEDIIEELRKQLFANNILLLQKEPRQSGNSLQIQCPYHGDGQEKKPSAGIRKSDGMFHCFACNEVHSLPEVISYCFGHYDDILGKFGWSWLLKNFATVSVEERKDVSLDFYRNNTQIHSSNRIDSDNIQDERFVTEEELDKYRYYHPYWEKRGIVDEKIMELFDLGYDRETKCITFPVRDRQGNCLFVARRSVNTKFFQYPPGVSKPLYGLYELYNTIYISGSRKSPSIMLCESMIDCILLWQSGHRALALNGLGNDRQFKQLMDLPIRHIILATDNDTAGLRARDRIKKNVKGKLFTEIDFPDGIKDIGECGKNDLKTLLKWEVW